MFFLDQIHQLGRPSFFFWVGEESKNMDGEVIYFLLLSKFWGKITALILFMKKEGGGGDPRISCQIKLFGVGFIDP